MGRDTGVSQFYLGIDLGGSNISAAILTGQGRILHLEKVKTLAEEGPQAVIRRIIDLSKSAQKAAGVSPSSVMGVGLGAPGIIRSEDGMVLYSPNLPGWNNIPLRRKLQSALKKPILVDNDANVAAYGEKWMGAGANYDNLVVYTLGTGVGGGIILGGEIYHGACSAAGEVGHTTILPDGPICGCGNRGCLEALASGTAIARAACMAVELEKRKQSTLYKMCLGDPAKVNAKMVFQAAAKGDDIAKKVVEESAMYLGIGIANIVNLLNPELIILGGGVSMAGEALLSPVRAEVKRRALKDTFACVKIVLAKLADKAGVIGAAGIAYHAHRKGAAKQGRRKS